MISIILVISLNCVPVFNDVDKTIKFDDKCYQEVKSKYEVINDKPTYIYINDEIDKNQNKFGGLK